MPDSIWHLANTSFCSRGTEHRRLSQFFSALLDTMSMNSMVVVAAHFSYAICHRKIPPLLLMCCTQNFLFSRWGCLAIR